MKSLTARQKEVLKFLVEHIKEFGYPPTTTEIASAFGFKSVTGAVQHLVALEKRGAIVRTHAKARGIRIV